MELFSLKNKKAIEKPVHIIDFFKYLPTSLPTINDNNSIVSISSSREDPYICLQNSCKSKTFEVLKQDDTRYAGGDQRSD